MPCGWLPTTEFKYTQEESSAFRWVLKSNQLRNTAHHTIFQLFCRVSEFNTGTYRYILIRIPVLCQSVLWSQSRPEPDFLAGAGAGEKAPALPLRLHKVATIFVKFSHILTIYTQIERKNRYT